MTTGRVLWIIWCLCWAGAWFLAGLLTVVGVLVFWPLALLSLLAILLPVGRPVPPQQARCGVCGVVGLPELLPLHMQVDHRVGGPAQLGQAGSAGPAWPTVIEQRPHAGPPPAWPAYGPPPAGRPASSPPPGSPSAG